MKQFFYGVLAMLVLGMVNEYVWLKTTREQTLGKASRFVKYQILEGGYILNPLLGNCQDREGQNGFGWKFNVADYYGCDRFQRLLNGNRKPYNPNTNSY